MCLCNSLHPRMAPPSLNLAMEGREVGGVLLLGRRLCWGAKAMRCQCPCVGTAGIPGGGQESKGIGCLGRERDTVCGHAHGAVFQVGD